MSCHKLCMIVVCLSVASSFLPTARGIPSGLLSVLANKSICKSVVEYDDNPSRVPRVIKQVKCAAEPDKKCPARDGSGADVSCCKQTSYQDAQFSCQEVIDTVLVSDMSGATSPKTVSIGCACAMKVTVLAEEV